MLWLIFPYVIAEEPLMYCSDNVSQAARNRRRFPDLICLGAQKSATTWLYDVLRSQRRVSLPPIKEIHYFSQLYNRDARNYGPKHRKAQATAAAAFFKKNPKASPEALSTKLNKLTHLAKAHVDDRWYGSIFADAPVDNVCIEICPSYMNLPMAGIQHVLSLNPVVKLLFLIRDPVDRCWSQIRMHMTRGIQDREIETLVSRDALLDPYLFYTDYAGSLRKWETYAAPHQIKKVLYDDIKSRPIDTLCEILEFAGVNDASPADFVNRAVFQGEVIHLPTRLRMRLLEALEPQYAYLRRHYPAQVEQWLAKHQAAIQTSPI
jgi:hypothetical protein